MMIKQNIEVLLFSFIVPLLFQLNAIPYFHPRFKSLMSTHGRPPSNISPPKTPCTTGCVCVCVSELFDSSWVLSVMNLYGFWVVFLLLQLTSFMPSFPTYINASSASDMAVNHHHVNPNGCLSDMPLNRKLKFQPADEQNKKKAHPSDVNLDDYHPIDPVPSSKTSVKPGPIEHGAPLLPHMPNPPPPAQPGDYA